MKVTCIAFFLAILLLGCTSVLSQEDLCGKFLWRDEFTFRITGASPGSTERVRVKVEVYEKCTRVTFLSTEEGHAVISGPIEIKPDGSSPWTKEGKTVTAFDIPLDNQLIGKTGDKKDNKRSGEIKVFTVSGCKNPRIVQYYVKKSTLTYQDGKKEEESEPQTGWKLDGGDPFPSSLKPKDAAGGTPADTGGILDVPGVSIDGLNNEELIKKLKSHGDGTAELTIEWKFETFFYCDGKLIGWTSKGMTLKASWKVKDGKVDPAAVEKPTLDAPKWHDPTEKSQSPGNK
jgi:hypothetical protein